MDFNERLQPRLLRAAAPGGSRLMGLEYDFRDLAGRNNGNLASVTDHLDRGRDRLYFYDALNRLESVPGIPWAVSYAYDRFGNRLAAAGTASTPNYTSSSLIVDPATNRVAGWS